MLYRLPSKRIQALLVAAIAILVNINTLHHQYALDDEMVIKKNMSVQKGLAGIGELLSSDAYKPYFTYSGADTLALSGGRYRPLSIVSFALEQQLFGKTLGSDYEDARESLQQMEQAGADPKQMQAQADAVRELDHAIEAETMRLAPIRHGLQLLYYALCCVAFFYLLNSLFKDHSWLPLAAALIFTVHPVHTEVVANLKSRDEIFSLLFIFLTCIAFIRFFNNAKAKWLAAGLAFYLLAFLSKEYAFALVVLIPLYYFLNLPGSASQLFKTTWLWLLIVCTGLFAYLRHAITNGPVVETTEVLNDPFLYAPQHQVMPSKIAAWIEYMRLLFFPFKLSSDYSYNSFPYRGWTSIKTLVSLIAWGAVMAAAIYTTIRRKRIAFAWVWVLAFFFMINNFFVPIGATIGERLIFHSSAGFCMLVVYYAERWLGRLSNVRAQTYMGLGLAVLVMIAFAYKTWQRNYAWKNDYTLFTTDVITMSNSALTNSNAGAQYFQAAVTRFGDRPLNKADSILIEPEIRKSIHYLSKAIAIHPRHVASHINRAFAYFFMNKPDSAIADWKIAVQLYQKRNPSLMKQAAYLTDLGLQAGAKKDFATAIYYLEPASMIDAYNPLIWNNLGGAYYMYGDLEKAAYAFEKALRLNPNLQDARNGYNAAKYNLELRSKNLSDHKKAGQ